jgi:hypothetical protein
VVFWRSDVKSSALGLKLYWLQDAPIPTRIKETEIPGNLPTQSLHNRPDCTEEQKMAGKE